MASLTDTLTSDDSVKPVRSTQVSSGGLATAIGGIGDALGAFEQFSRDTNIRNRQKAEDARRASKASAAYDASGAYPRIVESTIDQNNGPVRTEDYSPEDLAYEAAAPKGDIFGAQSSNLDPNTAKSLTDASNRLRNVQAAVDQGNMPRISLAAAVEREFQALRSRHPENVEDIIQTFTSLGLVGSTSQAIRDDQKIHNETLDANLKWTQNMWEKGMASLDPSLTATMSKDEVIAQGIRQTNLDFQLDQTSKQLAITTQNVNITTQQRQETEKTTNQQIVSQFGMDAYSASSLVIKPLQQLMIAASKSPNGLDPKTWENFGVQVNQLAENYIRQAFAKAQASGYTGSLEAFEAPIRLQFNAAQELFTGDQSLAAANLRSFQAFSNSMKSNAQEAMPAFMALRSLGFNPSEMQEFSEALAQNPTLMNQALQEVKGFQLEFGQERASTRLINLARMVRGELGIHQVSPEEARRAMPVLAQTSINSGVSYLQGNNPNPNQVLNSSGQVIVGARTLGPQSPLNSLYQATLGFTNPAVRNSLIKAAGDQSVDEQAKATIQGSRAASALILNSLNVKKPEVAGWTVVYDEKLGKAIAAPRANAPGAMTNRRLQTNRDGTTAPAATAQPMPEEVRKWVRAFNDNLDNITTLNNEKWDPTSLKGTPLEVRNFYATGKASEGIQKQLAQGAGQPIDINSEIQNIERNLTNALEGVPNMNETSFRAGIRAAESGGNDSVVNKTGSTATGRYQFTTPTWLNVARQLPEAEGLTDDQLLAKRTDGAWQERAMDIVEADYDRALANAGLPSSNTNKYILHNFGPATGVKLLLSDSKENLADAIRRIDPENADKILSQNAKEFAGKTVGDIIAKRSKAFQG